VIFSVFVVQFSFLPISLAIPLTSSSHFPFKQAPQASHSLTSTLSHAPSLYPSSTFTSPSLLSSVSKYSNKRFTNPLKASYRQTPFSPLYLDYQVF